jgi:hypothetical protein
MCRYQGSFLDGFHIRSTSNHTVVEEALVRAGDRVGAQVGIGGRCGFLCGVSMVAAQSA